MITTGYGEIKGLCCNNWKHNYRRRLAPLPILVQAKCTLEAVEPSQDFLSVFPIDQFIYLRILDEERLGVSDEVLLDLLFPRKVQMEIDGC